MWAQKQTGHWLHGHVPLQLGALVPKYWKEKIYKGLSAMCIFKKLFPLWSYTIWCQLLGANMNYLE